MSKPIVNLGFDVDLLSVCFDKFEHTDEELNQIFSAIKKKKKYVKLKNNIIVDINNENASRFAEIVEEFDLDDKTLTKSQKKPLYLAAKAFNHDESEHTFNYDERLKEIIYKIKHYKESNYQVPENLVGDMRKYQIEGFKWLKTLADFNLGGILADDMGLGKPLQIIALIVSDEKEMPSLIISPTSLIYNWQAEIIK